MVHSKKVRALKLRHTLEFQFATVPFESFQSIRALDLEQLARARRAVVELGQFEAGCCKRMARAVIKDGRVTEIEIDACTDGVGKVTPEFARLFARAHAKLKRSKGPAPRLPIPVTRFFRRTALGDVTIEGSVLDGMTCYMVCVSIAGKRVCAACCGTSPQDVKCLTMTIG